MTDDTVRVKRKEVELLQYCLDKGYGLSATAIVRKWLDTPDEPATVTATHPWMQWAAYVTPEQMQAAIDDRMNRHIEADTAFTMAQLKMAEHMEHEHGLEGAVAEAKRKAGHENAEHGGGKG